MARATAPTGETPSEGDSPPKPKRKRAAPKKAAAPKPDAPENPAVERRPVTPKVAGSAAPAAPSPAAKPTAPTPPSLAEVMMSRSGGDLEALSRNLAEAMTKANNVFATAFQDQIASGAAPQRMDPFDVQGTLNQTWSHLAMQPETLRDAHGDLWRKYAEIWQAHTARMIAGAEDASPGPSDKRFRDPEWQVNPFFSLMRETYLATAAWITNLVSSAEGLDEDTKRKAAFFIKQAVDAASPANFLFTNPTALRATLETRGENLLHGLDNLSNDLHRGHGYLSITQTDTSAFKVGENIATAPGKVIFRNDLIELIQYTPTTETVFTTPLLIFPPWINKFYILDLQPKNSFIRWLVAQGHTVFVASWCNPDKAMAEKTFEDYMREGVFAAVDAVCEAAEVETVNAVGYCIGGTLLASTLAAMAADGDEPIQSATFFAAQMDFELAGELKVFTDDVAIKYVSERIDAHGGFLDSQAMADTFNALRSSDLVWHNVVENYYMGKRPPPFDLLYWNSDQTRMPRALHLYYLKRFYHDNALAKGELILLNRKLNLGDVKIPVYMQSSKEDHISPAASVYRSAKLFGGPVRFMMAGSGHIAGVINPPAANKYQHWINDKLPATLEGWIAGATEHPGSWWHDWHAWLSERSGPMVDARTPGEGKLKALGDAPGEYVKVKSTG